MGYQEEKQRQLDSRYMRMARIWAENSYCVRRKVGALIVKDKMNLTLKNMALPHPIHLSNTSRRSSL